MKVRLHTYVEDAGRTLADFSCLAGRGRAVLCRGTEPDRSLIDQERDAELDIEIPIAMGVNCEYDPDAEIGILVAGKRVLLSMRVEQQDYDGMVYCRLSTDCIVMVEVDNGERLDLRKGIRMEVAPEDLSVTLL